MKKIRMLTLLVALCSAVESQASLFTLTEKNGKTTCSVPQAEKILKNYWKNEIAIRKGSESAVFEATMQHLEVVQADDVQLYQIESLVTANIVAKNLTISAFTNLIELKIDGCEDLYLSSLPALTKLVGPLAKKTFIGWCKALRQLDATGCEDLHLEKLSALKKIVGTLPKETHIEECNELTELDVTGCEDLELSFLDQLEKLRGTVPLKATIRDCPKLKEIEKVAFDAQGNPQESAALVNFLKDKTSENLPPSLSYLKKVGASGFFGIPLKNKQNIRNILENVRIVLQGTYFVDQFLDILRAASVNKKGFYLEFNPNHTLILKGKRSVDQVYEILEIIEQHTLSCNLSFQNESNQNLIVCKKSGREPLEVQGSLTVGEYERIFGGSKNKFHRIERIFKKNPGFN